jgi:hypothetical protein
MCQLYSQSIPYIPGVGTYSSRRPSQYPAKGDPSAGEGGGPAAAASIFEMFARGDFGLPTICCFLEERRVLTRTGQSQWAEIKSSPCSKTITILTPGNTIASSLYIRPNQAHPIALVNADTTSILHALYLARIGGSEYDQQAINVLSNESNGQCHPKRLGSRKMYCD